MVLTLDVIRLYDWSILGTNDVFDYRSTKETITLATL